MKWSISEEIIVCNYYFKITNSKYANYVDQINQELISKGFQKRTNASIIKKLKNCEYLDKGTGSGFDHCSEQNKKVFNALK